jgi:site-specific DNA-methyltransferase (adenine-specific)
MTTKCLNGDCLELMKTLPDNSVDLFMCDLPYGCLIKQKGATPFGRNTKGPCNSGCKWDVKIDLVAFWEQVKRLCKNDNTPVIMFCNTRFGVDLINSNPSWFRYDLVWNKNCGTNFLHANKRPMTSHELVYVFSKASPFYKRIDQFYEGKEAYTYKGGKVRGGSCFGMGKKTNDLNQEEGMRCPLSVLNFNLKRDKRHPTAKPLDLLKWFIERYSNEDDTVLDPTAGSFNSGRACVELGRNYIGIEMDKDFFEKNKL